MLDIISMIIILFFLMGLPMILIIIGGSKSKSEQERTYELEEEAQYWRDYEKEQIIHILYLQEDFSNLKGNKQIRR